MAKPNHPDYFANTWRSERRTPLRKRRIFCDRQMCATGSAVAGPFHSFNPKKAPVCAFLSTHCGRPSHVLAMSLPKGRSGYTVGYISHYVSHDVPIISPLYVHYLSINTYIYMYVYIYIKQDPNFKRVPLILAGALFRLWQQPFRLGGAGKKEPRTIRQWWFFPKNIYSEFNVVPHLSCRS